MLKTEKDISNQQQLYYRLISLWVICEGVAGGIMHGLNIPFSGMIISGCAVVCICLIGYYIPVKGAILKATVIVCIFKMMLSPHTPPTAYFAVSFQGLIGQILFFNTRHYKLSCIILGILALAESAIQRVLVLIILYGTDFWNAVNEFIKKLVHVNVITNYSWWLAIGYIFIHAIVGILIGLMASRIIKQSQSWKNIGKEYVIADINVTKQKTIRSFSSRKRRIKKGVFIIWLFLLFLFMQSFFEIGKPLLSSHKALQIFLRSLLIFLTWYFLVSPLISIWIKKRLQHQKEKAINDISQVVLLLPFTEDILRKSWEISASIKGFKRLRLFWKIVLINTLRKV